MTLTNVVWAGGTGDVVWAGGSGGARRLGSRARCGTFAFRVGQYMTSPSLSGCAAGTFSPFPAPAALVRGDLVYEAPLHPQEGGRHLVRASWRTNLPYADA